MSSQTIKIGMLDTRLENHVSPGQFQNAIQQLNTLIHANQYDVLILFDLLIGYDEHHVKFAHPELGIMHVLNKHASSQYPYMYASSYSIGLGVMSKIELSTVDAQTFVGNDVSAVFKVQETSLLGSAPQHMSKEDFAFCVIIPNLVNGSSTAYSNINICCVGLNILNSATRQKQVDYLLNHVLNGDEQDAVDELSDSHNTIVLGKMNLVLATDAQTSIKQLSDYNYKMIDLPLQTNCYAQAFYSRKWTYPDQTVSETKSTITYNWNHVQVIYNSLVVDRSKITY